MTWILVLALSVPAAAQVFRLSREQMVHYTPRNPYERFEDGRPRVPDESLRRLRGVTVAQAVDVLRANGYLKQFAGGFQILHPGKTLVGRAVTAQYLPLRPDLGQVLDADAKAAGMPSGANQKVIDLLRRDDVPVVQLMGAVEGNNFGGDNLHAAIYGATGTGAVVDGTVRDLEGLAEMETQVYYRAGHPAAVGGVVVAGINVPIHIGQAAVMPGDVVLADRSGVVFVPPHLVEEVLRQSRR